MDVSVSSFSSKRGFMHLMIKDNVDDDVIIESQLIHLSLAHCDEEISRIHFFVLVSV